jgi:hypothetical protein
VRRTAAIFLLLFAVYGATIGLRAFAGSDYAGGEPHNLLIAKSLAEDRSPDLRDEYAARAYDDVYPYALEPVGSLTNGRVDEPYGLGFPLLAAPAFAVGGAKGVELLLAALAALAVALGYRLALRVVPDPWAAAAALAVGLSPPLLAHSTSVYPEMAAGAALAGAALLALRIPDSPRRRVGWSAFGLLALLPWLGPKYLVPAAPIALYGYLAMRRARRPVLALTCVEIVGFSIALFVGLNEGLYGGPTPYSAQSPGESATGTDSPIGYVDRAYRLVALFVDRDFGLLRWAPVLALGVWGAWILLRERRSGLARAIPARRAAQSAGGLCATVAGAQLLVAAFLAPTMFGPWFPGRELVAALPVAIPLVAVGVRRAPRTAALLALVGIAASVWLYVAVRTGDGGLVLGRPDAPWGPLVQVFPRFEQGAVYPFAFAAVIAAALAGAAVWSELRTARRAPATG